jgi:hypothetical protein
MSEEITAAPAYNELLGRISEVDVAGQLRATQVACPKGAKPSHLLSWSHFVELLKPDNPLERSLYEQQAIHEKWSVPELQRQMKSSLFLRLAAGRSLT